MQAEDWHMAYEMGPAWQYREPCECMWCRSEQIFRVRESSSKAVHSKPHASTAHAPKSKAPEKAAAHAAKKKSKAAEKATAAAQKTADKKAEAAAKKKTADEAKAAKKSKIKEEAMQKHHRDFAAHHLKNVEKYGANRNAAGHSSTVEHHGKQHKADYHEQQYRERLEKASGAGTQHLRGEHDENQEYKHKIKMSDTTGEKDTHAVFRPWRGPKKQTINKDSKTTVLNTDLKIATLKMTRRFTGKECTYVMFMLLLRSIEKKDELLLERLFHYTNWEFIGADSKYLYRVGMWRDTVDTTSVVESILSHNFVFGRDLFLKHAREARLSQGTIRRLQDAKM